MRRWLPYPILSLALAAAWLVLNQSVDAAHILLGGALGLAGGRILAALQPPHRRPRRAAVALELFFLVLADIVRSNIAVGRIVLNPRQKRTAGFLSLPLELRHPAGLAAVACIVTATPGTSWARYDAARNIVTIHVLDLLDEKEWVHIFKQRYERRLREILE